MKGNFISSVSFSVLLQFPLKILRAGAIVGVGGHLELGFAQVDVVGVIAVNRHNSVASACKD